VGDYNAATALATKLTKEQLAWIQQLAVTTPFDAADVANVFTLARSYGFAADSAKTLTRDISDFAAGMGLGNTEIERIIVNFGQMVQQGKVTQRELNDLARGAFVPVNDVLNLMQQNLGMTDKEFEEFRYTGEGVQAFLSAFSQLVETRFAGATQQMARTFSGATANAQDFVKSLFGLNVLTPVLDVVGGKIADLLNSLTTPASRLGEALAGIFSDLFGGVDTGDFVNTLLQTLNRITGWVNENKGKIVGFFEGIGETITQKVVPFITDKLIPGIQKFVDFVRQAMPRVAKFFGTLGKIIESKIVPFVQNKLLPAFQKISDWVTENGGLIQEFFFSLGHIAGDALGGLGGLGGEGTGGLEGILEAVKGFMTFVVENNEAIGDWVELLTKVILAMNLLGAAFGFILSVVGTVIGFFVSLGTVVASVAAIVLVLLNPAVWAIVLVIGLLTSLIGWLIPVFIELGVVMGEWWESAVVGFQYVGQVIAEWWQAAVIGFQYVGQVLAEWIAAAIAGFQYVGQAIEQWIGYVGVGIAYVQQLVTDFVDRFLADIEQWGTEMLASVMTTINEIAAFIAASKGRMVEVAMEMMRGLALGVRQGASRVINAIVETVQAAIDAAKAVLGIQSPSKMFAEIGTQTMAGMARGILKGAHLAETAMEAAIGMASAPALNLPAVTQQMLISAAPMVATNNSYTNNYNLTVNTAAPVEPIVQDYNMLRSLAGA
jgi:tape measure domain-containing protein